MTTTLISPVPNPGRFHWTVDVFYRAIDAGVFDEPKRMELVKGELWTKEIVNPPHAITTRRIARLLRGIFEPDFFVSEEKPVHLSTDGEPIPDASVARGNEAVYAARHPTNAETILVVEVADTTVARDTGEKALLYAQAGIPEYWVSLINERDLFVYRNPTESGYDEPLRLTENDTVHPLARPDVEIAVRELLALVPSEPLPQ